MSVMIRCILGQRLVTQRVLDVLECSQRSRVRTGRARYSTEGEEGCGRRAVTRISDSEIQTSMLFLVR
jgi:hypothetical protein